ncbi:hypothetical protein P6144_00170 [Sphingomonas sp. HITSZ_GF]|uniref:hypothetical protein n=1 Tax=Sphingomonas sp. HITSZ_GF TaxID=3037247 RepID=UPI00240DB635|nr:hypothetical protein [Sphingomonas sp. HITSZ_GF]MDG2532050.1 hypothetical protein [Sphingomonas sp. HITSZ_GF]
MIFDDLDDDDDKDFWSIPFLSLPAIEIESEIGFDNLPAHTGHKPAWWQRTASEYWHTDYPEFSSVIDRGRWTVTQMAMAVLTALSADEDDPVLERPDGSPVSLSQLLAEMDELEMQAMFKDV